MVIDRSYWASPIMDEAHVDESNKTTYYITHFTINFLEIQFHDKQKIHHEFFIYFNSMQKSHRRKDQILAKNERNLCLNFINNPLLEVHFAVNL